jgi:hypothetical protein
MYSIVAALLVIQVAVAAPKKRKPTFYVEDIEFPSNENRVPRHCLNSSNAASTSIADFSQNYEAKEDAKPAHVSSSAASTSIADFSENYEAKEDAQPAHFDLEVEQFL